MTPPSADVIEIRGARQNNLKGIDLDLPLGRLNVITGPSGSGKSSLAFDTIYAEGQRRYVETFSPYTRQFLDRMDKPKVDAIHGIPPAIAIEQSNQVKSTRSTVGTITEINDYLKLLMPRVAHAFCPSCHGPIKPDSSRGIAEQILDRCAGATLLLTFAVPAPVGAVPAEFFAFLQAQGYLRVFIDGKVFRTDEPPADLKKLPLRVHVIQDRSAIDASARSRLTESIETALRFGKGRIRFIDPATGKEECFSTGWHCPKCDIDIKPPTPGLFSFNNPLGACPKCRGFGRTIGIDLDRALPDKRLSIARGVVKPFQSGQSADCQRDLLRAAARQEIDIHKPFEELPKADQKFVIQGEGNGKSDDELWQNGGWYGVKGYFEWLESKTYKMHVRVLLSRYRAYTLCPDCDGGRFQPATLNYRLVPGAEWAPVVKQHLLLPGFDMPGLAQLSVTALLPVMESLVLPPNDPSAEMLQKEVTTRLRYLIAVGLGYLNLDRPTRTLSGGEIERVNLTTCLGASLVNTLFVLDEPSVGLHPRDVGRLIRVMEDLRDKGNTLLVVEHEEAVIRSADNLIDIGPGRGEGGGELVFSGPLSQLGECPGSLTADYLTGRKMIPLPARRRPVEKWLRIRGAREHNLQRIDVDLPLGVFGCVTGVSGSGKSTLIHDVLFQNLLRINGQTSDEAVGRCDGIEGTNQLGPVVMVDQTPLSKTPRSSPVVYLGVFDAVRELFATSDEARSTGLSAGSFSFNSGDGRCERCGGIGFEKIEMQFLSDLYVRCTECEGKRFQPHVLKVRYHGKNIHEVLELTVTESIPFLETRHGLKGMPASLRMPLAALRTLEEVGLGYLRLGQPLNTLSGGEAQRLKLVGHLVERERNPHAKGALLIFDEPTTGLHFDDVALLVRVFQRLVDQGDSLLVIEHNLEVIKCADYLVDLGPEAGADGGLLVAAGTPEEVAAVDASHTGYYLQPLLEGARNEKMIAFDGVAVEQAANVINGNGHAASRTLRASEMRAREPHALLKPAASPSIRVHGAREHNLKNISLDLPRGRMVIVTGLSGSGKSTLAFDILFAEGQRRFLDSMSPYARQFVEQLEKPDVDFIEGLPPSVAIEQRVTRGGGKSTVATVTEVYHFLRLLFAKLGTQYCPECQVPVQKQSEAAIIKQVEDAAKKGRVRVLAPLIKARKGFHTEVAAWAVKHGFDELWVDGAFRSAHGFAKLERFREHTIDVVVGEIGGAKKKAADKAEAIVKKGNKLKNASVGDDPREIIKRALDIGKGTARFVDAKGKSVTLSTEMSCPECRMAFEELDPRLFSYNSPHGWCPTCRGFGVIWKGNLASDDDSLSEAERELAEERATQWLDEDDEKPCPECQGGRLNAVARNVRVRDMTIDSFARLPVSGARAAAGKFKFKGTQAIIATDILEEIRQRLTFMEEVGLGYLALDRSAKTLSGGETQRIRLSAQLGSNLRGVLYVLDEPTIGLHPRDNDRLLDTLEALRGKGNSLIIVEHDDETMRRADHIIDLGPGPGVHGGEIVAQGTRAEIEANPQSITGRHLKDPIRHPMNGVRRPIIKSSEPWLELKGASANNLQNVDVKFPVGRLSVITGISGSGKSSLMRAVLLPAAQQALAKGGSKKAKDEAKKTKKLTSNWKTFTGVEHLEAVYEVDQSPIGKTSRSTPATYVGVLDEIRALFAQLPLARIRGYTNGRFSFNNEGGRCETCLGQGVIKHEMSFLPTSYVPCEDCGGLRYNAQTLEVLYNDKSIGQVLQLTIEQAAEFFAAVSKIHRALSLLTETGLGYLRLGQPSPTLSGGEAQRLKLVTELTRGVGAAQHSKMRKMRAVKSTLYLLEEPTVGLHMADVEQLLRVLHRLTDEGNTVVVIEHHLSVIAEADYLVDIGPEAGDAGGKLVASGTPEQVARHKVSRIAPFLHATLRLTA